MADLAPVLYAMAGPSTGAAPNPFFQFVIPSVLVFLIFYFLVLAPGRKKAKAHAEMLQALKAGDKVLTAGGLYGTVVGVDDAKIQLRIADQVKVEVARHAISEVSRAGE